MAGIMEAIKKGFGIATKSLGLVLIMMIFNLVWNLASIPLAIEPGAALPPEMATVAVIFSLLFVLTSIFVQGGALGLVRDRIKEGKVKLAGFASYGFKYYLKLLGVGIVIILIIAIIAIIASLIIIATAPLNNDMITNIAIVIAIAIGVITGLFFFIPLALSPYAIVCDELGIIGAMKKGLEVVRPIGKAMLLALLFVILILISIAITYPIVYVATLIAAAMPAVAGKVVIAIITSIVNGYLGIVMMVGFMTYYMTLSKGKTA